MKNQLVAAALCFTGTLGGCATSRAPLDQETAQAVMKHAPGTTVAQAEERIRGLTRCPTEQFAPATPLSFLVATMDSPDADPERAKALFRLYRDAGCDIHAPDRAGLQPVHSAILFRNPAALQFLLDSGADPALPVEAPSKQAGKTGYELAALVCAKQAERCPALAATLDKWKSAKGLR